MRLSKVEEVLLRIAQQVRQLDKQGQITNVRGDSDDQFVYGSTDTDTISPTNKPRASKI